ncbi:MAG: hypothetical protein WB495_27285 [Xanthobacteraceae bacterium]
MTAITATVEAGIGVMVAPLRAVPDTLIVTKDRILPKLPQLTSAVFFKEGFDVKRHRALVEAFISAVAPPSGMVKRLVRPLEKATGDIGASVPNEF